MSSLNIYYSPEHRTVSSETRLGSYSGGGTHITRMTEIGYTGYDVLKYLQSFCLLRLRRYWVISRSLLTGTNRSNMGHTSQKKQDAFPDVTAPVMVMTMLVTMLLIRLCASSLF